jgi:hypothetical protein
LFFQGARATPIELFLSEDWKKWAIWDCEKREWTVLQCRNVPLNAPGEEGFYCLFREYNGVKERVGLDWVRMEV